MEFKWFMIAVMVIVGAMGTGIVIEKYTQGVCRVAAINKGMSAEDIANICK